MFLKALSTSKKKLFKDICTGEEYNLQNNVFLRLNVNFQNYFFLCFLKTSTFKTMFFNVFWKPQPSTRCYSMFFQNLNLQNNVFQCLADPGVAKGLLYKQLCNSLSESVSPSPSSSQDFTAPPRPNGERYGLKS